MSEYAGSVMYLGWVYSGGTVTFHADYRTFSWAPTLNWIDATAGSDPFEHLLPSFGVGSEFGADCLLQAGGTAVLIALARGTGGTVVYGPEGTASGKIKYSIPATASGPQFNQSYNDVSMFRANWRQTAVEARAAF